MSPAKRSSSSSKSQKSSKSLKSSKDSKKMKSSAKAKSSGKMKPSKVKPSAKTKSSGKMKSLKPAKAAKIKKAAKPKKYTGGAKLGKSPKSLSPSAPRAGNLKIVGHSIKKIDGLALATGRAAFVTDELPRDYVFGVILTSPHAHARIVSIDTSEAEALPGVYAVLHHGNVPRIAHTTAGQGYPEPSPYDTFMFDNKVRYVGDRVAAVAAETRAIALDALHRIHVKYEILPPVFDLEEALAPGAPVIHDEEDISSFLPFDPKKNLAAWADAETGNLDQGLEKASVVLSHEYETHYTSHAAIEPHVCAAWQDDKGRLMIRVSTQVPFHSRRIVAQTLGIPVRDIRVIKPRLGGGFGGKQEVLLEDVCALLALRARRPVLMEYTRAEDLASSRTRHPMRIKMTMGAKNSGEITAIGLDGVLNTGAYGSHALTVLTNVGSKCLALFKCDNIRFRGRTSYTNLPVGGAYRGYGATQGMFALGSIMDEMAHAIGMDPLEFCLRNHIREGETSPIFKALGEGREGVEMRIGSCGLEECIRRGAREIGWVEKRRLARDASGPIRRGVGMTILMQGSSIPEIDMAAAALKLNDDGSVNLHIGATDLGTGSDTILAQIAAEALKLPIEDVIVFSSDTDHTPFDTGAYASSTTYLSGQAVRRAAERLLDELFAVASEMLGVPVAELDAAEKRIFIKGIQARAVDYQSIALRSLYMKNQRQLSASASAVSHVSPPPFSAHFAEVEVDMETGLVRCLRYVAGVDCGRAINPQLAQGQAEGAVINALSSALTEEYIFNQTGRMMNPTFNYYKIFAAPDIPDLKVFLVETDEPSGPYGAKSVSEICTNGPLPAIANAIFNATGARVRKSPFTPESVLAAIDAVRDNHSSSH